MNLILLLAFLSAPSWAAQRFTTGANVAIGTITDSGQLSIGGLVTGGSVTGSGFFGDGLALLNVAHANSTMTWSGSHDFNGPSFSVAIPAKSGSTNDTGMSSGDSNGASGTAGAIIITGGRKTGGTSGGGGRVEINGGSKIGATGSDSGGSVQLKGGGRSTGSGGRGGAIELRGGDCTGGTGDCAGGPIFIETGLRLGVTDTAATITLNAREGKVLINSPLDTIDLTAPTSRIFGNFLANSSVTASGVFATQVSANTPSPISPLEVGTPGDAVRSYLHIDSEAGAPPAGDCDANNESGRMVIDHTNDRLYICNQESGRGWDYFELQD